MKPTTPPIEHWNYDELDANCSCRLCSDYRAVKRAADFAPAIPNGHSHQCRCETCRERRRLANQLVCVSNQRDLYSEMSFLVQRQVEKTREGLLAWLYRQIRDPQRRHYFWIHTSEGKPLGSWIEDWWEDTRGARMAVTRILARLDAERAG